ncbi:uncharacterized protein CC84DRAFT_1212835 [Paraphaeosphaeria sporulosa]|uniref:Uncharacterized protein n=1 Tax=Paraphaeosphaeria sporulosa TaxID=1460663 RepID=A0A177CPE4_9PLEO|nr:uncharacterized protein CC84DRAFT_1212835 [Paraphaeosphaeria sporulosa]OAG09395.1 hypothetical protein CC84DRAFT_1212835 [Paraphaeosphaeria sporulosa]
MTFTASLDNNPLRQLTKNGRRALRLGPTFDVVIDKRMIAKEIPKRAAMAISKVFNEMLTKHQRYTTFMLNDYEVSKDWVFIIIDFIIGNVKVNNTFALRNKEKTFPQEVALYRHAVHQFGMEHHAGAMRATLLGCLNKDIHMPTNASLDELVTLPDTDPLYNFYLAMKDWKKEREARKANQREVQRQADFERNFPTLK